MLAKDVPGIQAVGFRGAAIFQMLLSREVKSSRTVTVGLPAADGEVAFPQQRRRPGRPTLRIGNVAAGSGLFRIEGQGGEPEAFASGCSPAARGSNSGLKRTAPREVEVFAFVRVKQSGALGPGAANLLVGVEIASAESR